jgi:hypothetical protein
VVSINGTPHHGSQCIQLLIDGSGSNNGIATAASYAISVLPSTQYTFSVYVKSDTDGQLQVQFRDAASGGNYLQDDNSTWNSTPQYTEINTTTSWARYTRTFTTGASQTVLRIADLKRSGAGAGEVGRTFWIDAAQIQPGANATTFCVEDYFEAKPAYYWDGAWQDIDTDGP